MKNTEKKSKQTQKHSKIPAGLPEFLAAAGIFALVFIMIFCIRSCDIISDSDADDGIYEDTVSPAEDTPTSTFLDTIPTAEEILPFSLAANITIDQVYTATGYFPEDGSDEAVENVLAVRLTNNSNRTLEYLTFSIDVNGESYPFSVSTLPAGKSVYVFNSERKTAPDTVSVLDGKEELEIYFSKEPSAMADTLSYEIQNGTIVVTNISEKEIKSDIMVYYKSTADSGYFGGITYRFRIGGGLAAGQSFSAYAPHAYTHMTEIMFAQYEE